MTNIHHGSPSCYTNNKCREKPCREAWARYNKEQRAIRGARPLPEGREHGVYTTYTNYGCRCTPCKKANTEQRKKRQEV
jgi:hypothetical protein